MSLTVRVDVYGALIERQGVLSKLQEMNCLPVIERFLHSPLWKMV